jgi:hypothetical protein
VHKLPDAISFESLLDLDRASVGFILRYYGCEEAMQRSQSDWSEWNFIYLRHALGFPMDKMKENSDADQMLTRREHDGQ